MIRKLELNVAPGGLGDMLLCPCCTSGEYLHHDTVEVFERAEDAASCRQTTVTLAETLIQKTNGRGNPSYRRNGAIIQFWCEECGARSVLELAQHKGSTFLKHRCIEPTDGEVSL